MEQSSDLTSAEAVELLLLRHELGGMVKQAYGSDFFKSVGETLQGLPSRAGETFNQVRNAMPTSDQISSGVQRVMTPGTDDHNAQAMQRALMGAGIGAGVGLGTAALGRRKHWLSRALTGALLGGSAGAALPLMQRGAETAFSKTPTMKAQDAVKTEQNDFLAQRRGVEPPASPDASPALPQNTSGWLNNAIDGALNPDRAARAATIEAERMNYPAAAAEAAPIAGRSLLQGAAGYGLGRAITARRNIPYLLQEGEIGSKLPPEAATAMRSGTHYTRPTATVPAAGGGTRPAVTPEQWRNTLTAARRKGPRGWAGPVLGTAAAAEPIVEAATGYTPGSFIRSLFGDATK